MLAEEATREYPNNMREYTEKEGIKSRKSDQRQ